MKPTRPDPTPDAGGLDPGELLPLKQVAALLRVHYQTVWRWVAQGRLPALRAGGRIRVRAGDLHAFLADAARPQPGPRRKHETARWVKEALADL